MKIISYINLIFDHLIILYTLKTYGFTMEIFPIDSPHLQMLSQNFTAKERHQFLVNLSLSRAYRSRESNTTLLKPNTITLQPMSSSGYFIVPLAIGNRPGMGPNPGDGAYLAFAVLDTGDHELWIQCQGCEPCFEFEGKKFDYRESVTYERMAIHDNLCTPRIDYHGSCGFSKEYGLRGEGEHVKGMVGRDTFFLINKEIQLEVFNGLAFGCAFENLDFKSAFAGPQNQISGILGLRQGPRSFLTQLETQIQGRFSYCLAPVMASPVRPTTMYFGDDAQIKGDETRRVQAITMSSTLGYRLSMIGISVDGSRLPIDPSIFESKPGASTGFIIDSGSTITILAKTAYDPFHDAIAKYFGDKYGWQPVPHDPKKTGYKLCYKQLPTGDQSVPSVIFHFKRDGQQGEVDMVFAPYNMFTVIDLDSTLTMCFMVIETADPGPCLFGAAQQGNFRILYDIPNSLLYFVPENCLATRPMND